MGKLNSLADLKKLFPEAEGTHQSPKKFKSNFKKQFLEAHFSNKGRSGKTVTVIKGFVGTDDEIKSLAKLIKLKFGVGGGVKNQEIVIQGNIRKKIIDFLEFSGHYVKRVGG